MQYSYGQKKGVAALSTFIADERPKTFLRFKWKAIYILES